MLRKLSLTTLTVCFAFAFASANGILKHKAEVLVSADDKLAVVSASESTTPAFASWLGLDAPKNVSATKTVSSDKWSRLNFVVAPSSDGDVKIALRSNFARDEKKNILDNKTLFRNLTVNGKPCGSPFLQNENGMLATYGKKITAVLKAKKGEKLDVSVFAKVPAKWDGTVCVDLSPYANIPADGSKGGLTPFKNLPSSTVELRGMKYNFVNPQKTKGNVAVNITPAKPFFADLKDKKIQGKYVYIIGAVDNSLDYTDRAFGSAFVRFQDGSTAHFWLRKNRDFGNSAEPPKNHSKCMPVFVDDKNGGKGVLYFTQLAFKFGHSPIESIEIKGEKLNVFAVTVSNENVPSIVPYEYDLSQWKPVDLSDLEIKDGSALDVADGIGKDNAGRYGKVRISKSGHFEFEKMPNKPVKFKGTNWRPGDMFGRSVKTHADIDALAKMVRKQGYNLVRWRLSMRQDEFAAPYRLKEYNKDMYDYFFYAMAREGVYSHFNLASHDLGNPNFKWEDRQDVKILMFFGDEQTRRDWRKLVNMELNLVNKYTGKKWKDDPSIVTTEYFNEIELGPVALHNASPKVKKFVNEKFAAFLKNKYKTFENWNEPEWKKRFNLKSFDDVKVSEAGTSHHDIAQFFIESGRDMQRFCENVVRGEEGFKAPLHQHNCVRTTAFALMSAEAGDYSALNVYHMHPTSFMTPGSYVSTDSSMKDYAEYFRAAAAKRVSGRPMMLSEWQHCHWNPFKHEGGVLFPAYASLQGFDNLTIHDVAVLKKVYSLGPFEVAGNPVFRANEFLSYVLFYRGDVKASPHRVDLVYDREYTENSKEIGNAMNKEQSKIALLTGFGITFPSARETPAAKNIKHTPASLKIEPVGSSESWSVMNFSSTGAGDKKFDIDAMAETLREKGILPKGNISNPKEGVFQSDTGEITMRVKDELVKVVTPKTEAAAIKPKTKNEKLGLVTVREVSVPAAFAVTSVDGKPLENSKRMVVIFNTDNIATNFKVSSNRTVLMGQGTAPVLMQTGKVSAAFKVPTEKKTFITRIKNLFTGKSETPNFSLYALKITGERMEKIPLKIRDGVMDIEIDTSKLKEFSPFFELVSE